MAWGRDWLFFGAAWCHFLAGSLVAAAAATDAPVIRGCDGDGNFGPPFNATGTVSFVAESFTHNNGKPWYLSVGLKDRRDKNAAYPGVQTATGYLSLPDDYVRSARTNTTQMCVYHLGQRNTTASPDGSCQGVIDDACAKLIHKFQESPSFSNGKCPLLPSDDVCGSQIFQLDTPITPIRSNCSTSVQPVLAGLPDAYNTQPIFDLGLPYGDTKVDAFTAFDSHVRQSNPVLLVFGAKQDQDGKIVMYDSKLLCVAPVNATAGSHVPKSSAGELRVPMALLSVTAAITLLGLFLC
ncbi:Protein kinase-like domain protein [Cordyceps fumosorosea ARSEF 2679]|uniref:Protein kinase-like domain protein n=1 Tax=Cordyceps fumosorosea (strain ARSEF 2679) TaxID=1081104 RepID=A0A166Z2U7_CORFA|nr:Protein kinase-like domain protein [Cordyceps fumosorosea ARSEF 2679]OAA37495.1 Protein kinase-like domain protein [Cordyceps fumosorosea ARSEF 2679]